MKLTAPRVINGELLPEGTLVELNKATLDDINTTEGRHRAFHSEIESIIAISGALNTLKNHIPRVERLARCSDYGWQEIRASLGLLDKAMDDTMEHVNLEQLISVGNTTRNMMITYRTVVEPPLINLEEEQVDMLVRMAQCQNCSVCEDGLDVKKWRQCDARRLFDVIPVREGVLERSNYFRDLCPYVRGEQLP
ncbi:MAG: hypothetical protein Q4Q25_03190 [Methanocorpusculum sp.]|nr:hypothetical protein [Methanocorpusculum sp.]